MPHTDLLVIQFDSVAFISGCQLENTLFLSTLRPHQHPRGKAIIFTLPHILPVSFFIVRDLADLCLLYSA